MSNLPPPTPDEAGYISDGFRNWDWFVDATTEEQAVKEAVEILQEEIAGSADDGSPCRVVLNNIYEDSHDGSWVAQYTHNTEATQDAQHPYP